MRRPGFLGTTDYWFSSHTLGDECWVCEGNRCKNVCSKAKQKTKIKQRHKKIREVARTTKRKEITPSTREADFALIPGEGTKTRLARLQAKGLYVPGAHMSIEYGNLIHYGTTDRHKIARIKQTLAAAQTQRNIERYGTSDIKKITQIVAKETAERDAMWQRIYGTKDPDKIYAIPDAKRKRMCDADSECTQIRDRAQGKTLAGAFAGLAGLAYIFLA